VTYRKTIIRSYRTEDETVLFSLARTSFGDRSEWEDGRTLAVLETDLVFVAELDGRPAGYVAIESEGDSVRIEQLFVSPEHEGEGVGRQLLEYAEGFAISQGARTLQVVVEGDNRRALSFYGGRGFTEAGAGLFQLVLPQV
jgi:ribosomal protein S18 acetylase RimI-like enzyme